MQMTDAASLRSKRGQEAAGVESKVQHLPFHCLFVPFSAIVVSGLSAHRVDGGNKISPLVLRCGGAQRTAVQHE